MCSRTVPSALQQVANRSQNQAQTSPKQALSDTRLVLGTNRFAPLICSHQSVLPATVHIAAAPSTNFAIWKEVYVNKNTAVDFRAD